MPVQALRLVFQRYALATFLIIFLVGWGIAYLFSGFLARIYRLMMVSVSIQQGAKMPQVASTLFF